MHGMCFFTPKSWEIPSVLYTAGSSWAFLLGFGCRMIFLDRDGDGHNKKIWWKCRKLPKQTGRGKRLLQTRGGRLYDRNPHVA